MSLTMSILSSVNDAIAPATEFVAGECEEDAPGIFGWGCETSNNARPLIEAFLYIAALVGFVILCIQGKWAFSRVLIAGLVCSVGLWIGLNLGDVKDEAGENLPGNQAISEAVAPNDVSPEQDVVAVLT